MRERRTYTYEEFPESTVWSEGIRVIQADRDSIGVTGKFNIEYINRDNTPLHIHLLKPLMDSDPDRRWPLVVYIPGSGWMKQDLDLLTPMLSRLASRGFVVAVTEYRSSFVAPFPAQICDTKTAIRYLRKNADLYKLDPEQVILFGNSSGGHTVLIAGFTGDAAPDTADYGEFSCSVCGIIDNYGPTELGTMDDDPRSYNDKIDEAPRLEGEARKDPIRALIGSTPVAQLDAKNFATDGKAIPPVMITHGSKDRVVPFSQSVKIFDYLKEIGADVRMNQVKGGDHGIATYWTEDLIDVEEEFIRYCLNKRAKG